jgi:hypothetical protein
LIIANWQLLDGIAQLKVLPLDGNLCPCLAGHHDHALLSPSSVLFSFPSDKPGLVPVFLTLGFGALSLVSLTRELILCRLKRQEELVESYFV